MWPQVATQEVYEYHAVADVWVAKAPMPTPRFRFAAAAFGGEVFTFGGHQTCTVVVADTFECHATAHSSVEAYLRSSGDEAPLWIHTRTL
jgi:hypothetical protein